MKWVNSLKDSMPKLTQEEIDNLSRSVSIKEIDQAQIGSLVNSP